MLKISNLNVYRGKAQILWDVSIEVKKGEAVAVIGSNGAGKTTLLKTICGLVKPFSGEIEFLDKNIVDMPPHEIVRMGISLVPEGRYIFPQLTVYENLLLGSYLHKSPEYRKERLRLVYTIFPILEKRCKQQASTLSGGEQQMLAIGRALMLNPKLLCLDEPTLGLSPLFAQKIMETIERLREEITVLLVEQNVVHALTISDRAYVLENGKIFLQGSARDLLRNDLVKKSYLGIS